MRKESIANHGEMSIGNIIFKVLRRSNYLQKLYDLKNDLYVYKKSLFELKAKDVTKRMGWKSPKSDPWKAKKLKHIDGTMLMAQ